MKSAKKSLCKVACNWQSVWRDSPCCQDLKPLLGRIFRRPQVTGSESAVIFWRAAEVRPRYQANCNAQAPAQTIRPSAQQSTANQALARCSPSASPVGKKLDATNEKIEHRMFQAVFSSSEG